jgi:hypothetical protein
MKNVYAVKTVGYVLYYVGYQIVYLDLCLKEAR